MMLINADLLVSNYSNPSCLCRRPSLASRVGPKVGVKDQSPSVIRHEQPYSFDIARVAVVLSGAAVDSG